MALRAETRSRDGGRDSDRQATWPGPRAGCPDPDGAGQGGGDAQRAVAGRRPHPGAGEGRAVLTASRRWPIRQCVGDADALPAVVDGAYFAEVPLDSITPNPRQPRVVFDEEALAELVHSLREVGLLQPVVVRPLGADRYELIMGERRWRAAREAGFTAIPAIVRETEDDELLRDALLENLHRSQLNPLEEAAAYDQLLQDFGCTHDELAGRIGRSRPQISNTLRLLKLPPAVQRRVAAGVLSAGHARALLGLDDAAAQERLAQRIVAEGLVGPHGRGDRRPRGRPAGGRPGTPQPPADGAQARRPGRPAVRPVRDPGQGRPRSVQGPDRRGVRLDRRPRAHRRPDGSRTPSCRRTSPRPEWPHGARVVHEARGTWVEARCRRSRRSDMSTCRRTACRSSIRRPAALSI